MPSRGITSMKIRPATIQVVNVSPPETVSTISSSFRASLWDTSHLAPGFQRRNHA
jgi:hypothetical protein